MITDGHSFTAIKDQNSGCQRVWFTVELQVKPAPPDYTLTLVSPTLSATNVHLKIDSPHFESLQLEVLYKSILGIVLHVITILCMYTKHLWIMIRC